MTNPTHGIHAPKSATWILATALLTLAACDGSRLANTAEPTVEPGAAEAAVEVTKASLALTVREQTDSEIAIDLRYLRRQDQAGPRVAEIHLRHSPGLELQASRAGSAATLAGKEVVVQPTEDGVLRTVLYSTTSLDRLDSGVIATYRFARTGGGAARIELLPRLPVFAPAEANQGVLLGETLEIAGI